MRSASSAFRLSPGAARQQIRPILRYAGRILLCCFGLWVFALGVVVLLRASLGLGPWDAFHQGLSHHLPITLGQASIATSLTIVLVSLLLGIKPGLATLLNGVLVGFYIDQINSSPLMPVLANAEIPLRLLSAVIAVLITGVGSALYLKPRLGAGPRDSLMLALRDRLHIRVGLARAVLELSALACGWLLGGSIGVGTLIFAFGIGPAIELSFKLFRVKGHQREMEIAPRRARRARRGTGF